MPKITLSRPVALFDEPIREVEVREPTCAMYLDLGDPGTVARNPDGTLFHVEDREVVAAYIKRCVVHDHVEALLMQLSLEDGRRLKETVLSFFYSGGAATSSASSAR